ncbi:hypothetical protein GQ43DRAFT_435136 [Delitschia confertaspora ATCC 74209]|uniref:Uncharacterized protein n=1 Tax=Delitschia confertaspora ATCC 74209 TaxID=1513339 RepID=A0A9P4JIS9_9PLEO|nr:hypothetical protein GQ43DRAFT_435136 [Delitschia confertaspora ATCC 74209]
MDLNQLHCGKSIPKPTRTRHLRSKTQLGLRRRRLRESQMFKDKCEAEWGEARRQVEKVENKREGKKREGKKREEKKREEKRIAVKEAERCLNQEKNRAERAENKTKSAAGKAAKMAEKKG